ncbi:MAG TPA: LCP family protein [Nitriliruptorales bacterium]|nr:LCP family protein [Nitriliruptorales bacterium]
MRWVRAGMVLLVALGLGTAGLLYGYAGNRIARRDIDCLADAVAGCVAAADVPRPVEGVRNVLVVGTDSREGLSQQQLTELGTEDVAGPVRADTIMLVHMSPQRDDVVMVSFPRDLRAAVPGEGVHKLNAARALGGPELLVRTVEDFTGIAIHHYVEVNIAGFLRLVDVVGGVAVCLEEPLVDPEAGADIPAGRHVLTGKDAAGYVRARKSDPRGDLGRIERQQLFLRQALDRVMSPRTLANPLRVKRLIDRGARAVVTDSGFSTAQMFRLAWSFKNLDPDRVTMLTVPSDAGRSYVEARPEAAEALFQAIRADRPLPADQPAAPAAPDPTDIRIELLNGAGIDGLAAAVAEQLQERQLRVTETGNAERFGVERTRIEHAAGDESLARHVGAYFPSARLAEVDQMGDNADIRVVLGSDLGRPPVLATPTATPRGAAPTAEGLRPGGTCP